MLGTPRPKHLGFLCIRSHPDGGRGCLPSTRGYTPSLTQGFSVPSTVWGHMSKQEEGRKLVGPRGDLSEQTSKISHFQTVKNWFL